MNEAVEPREAFIEAAIWHGSLERAEAMLAEHPELAGADHVAAWLAQPAIVRLLIERGSPVDVPDANRRTPLALAVRAFIDSYWTERRSPESVRALLDAGASVAGVKYPSGYAEVDQLLAQRA